MKRYTHVLTLFMGVLTLLSMTNATPPKPKLYKDVEGVIIVSVYSRGAYQFILATPNATAKTRLYPVNLSEAMQEEAKKTDPKTPLRVRFSGRLTGKKEMMKIATANDAGANGAAIPQITLSAIQVVK